MLVVVERTDGLSFLAGDAKRVAGKLGDNFEKAIAVSDCVSIVSLHLFFTPQLPLAEFSPPLLFLLVTVMHVSPILICQSNKKDHPHTHRSPVAASRSVRLPPTSNKMAE